METVTTIYEEIEPGEKKPDHLLSVTEYKGNAAIRLNGKWLKDAGFEIGDKVAVEVKENQMVLKRLRKKEL